MSTSHFDIISTLSTNIKTLIDSDTPKADQLKEINPANIDAMCAEKNKIDKTRKSDGVDKMKDDQEEDEERGNASKEEQKAKRMEKEINPKQAIKQCSGRIKDYHIVDLRTYAAYIFGLRNFFRLFRPTEYAEVSTLTQKTKKTEPNDLTKWQGRKAAYVYRNEKQIFQETIENILIAVNVIICINYGKAQFLNDNKKGAGDAYTGFSPHILRKALEYYDNLAAVNGEKKETFSAYILNTGVLDLYVSKGIPDTEFALKVLDTDKMNQVSGNFHLYSATLARIILVAIRNVLKHAGATAKQNGMLNRFIQTLIKLQAGLKIYYARKSKVRCERITKAVRGYSETYSNFYVDESKKELTDEEYAKVFEECKNKDFLCGRRVQARKNFDYYVDKKCEPTKSRSMLGGKNKKKTKKRSQNKKNKSIKKMTGGMGCFGWLMLVLAEATGIASFVLLGMSGGHDPMGHTLGYVSAGATGYAFFNTLLDTSGCDD